MSDRDELARVVDGMVRESVEMLYTALQRPEHRTIADRWATMLIPDGEGYHTPVGDFDLYPPVSFLDHLETLFARHPTFGPIWAQASAGHSGATWHVVVSQVGQRLQRDREGQP